MLDLLHSNACPSSTLKEKRALGEKDTDIVLCCSSNIHNNKAVVKEPDSKFSYVYFKMYFHFTMLGDRFTFILWSNSSLIIFTGFTSSDNKKPGHLTKHSMNLILGLWV